MIEQYDYDRVNMLYSRGQVRFEELIAVINGRIALADLEASLTVSL